MTNNITLIIILLLLLAVLLGRTIYLKYFKNSKPVKELTDNKVEQNETNNKPLSMPTRNQFSDLRKDNSVMAEIDFDKTIVEGKNYFSLKDNENGIQSMEAANAYDQYFRITGERDRNFFIVRHNIEIHSDKRI